MIGRLTLVVGGFVTALLLLEVAVRVYTRLDPARVQRMEQLTNVHNGIGFRWEGHPLLPFIGTRNMDYSVQRDDEWAQVEITGRNNAFGFRTSELPTTKGPKDLHVVTLGGSTTWGAIAESNDTTWAGLLQGRLARQYPDKNVTVFNFGISTATSAFSIVTLSTIGVHLEPDLVIVYHGKTDNEPIHRNDYKTDQSHYFKDFDARWLGFRRSLPAWLVRSNAIAFVTGAWDEALQVNALMFYVTKRGDAWVDEGLNPVRRMLPNLKTLHDVAEAHGARTLFSTFQLFDPAEDPTLNDELRAFFRANNYRFVDQDALIPDLDRTINIDDCHFTRKGREMVAENFFNAILEYGLLDEAASDGRSATPAL